MPPDGHAALLAAIATLPNGPDRPFPTGAALVELAAGIAPLETAKPLRDTEKTWSARGVNTRSTLWNGPRGGAPFAAACLALLARARRPVWPWSTGPKLLVESFPAAQLKAWGLPHTGYAAPDQRAARDTVLGGLCERLDINPEQAELLLDCPDALDAVLAAFGAIAAATQDVPLVVPRDGLIFVMDAPAPVASAIEVRKAAPAKGSKSAAPVQKEKFESLLDHAGTRIERITSRGHMTPGDQPYERNDVGIRVGALPDAAGTSKLIGRMRRIVVAAPSYLAQHGTPEVPRDIGRHRVIAGPAASHASSWKFERDGKSETVDVKPIVSTNDTAGALAAAAGGLGITSTTSWACRLELESGALMHLLPEWKTAELPVHAYFPMGRATRISARAFVDFIAADLRDTPPNASFEQIR